MQRVIELLATKLEEPRELSDQVLRTIETTCGVGRDGIAVFLQSGLLELQDYEIDLIFSPLFTPSLPEQAEFAERLGMDAIPATTWPEGIRQLVSRPTLARLLGPDVAVHRLPLREVTVDRYVNRLRLDGTIPPQLFELIQRVSPAVDRPLLKAVARRAVWDCPARRDILQRFLDWGLAGGQYRLSDGVALLKLLESYQPVDAAALLAQIPGWEQVVRHQIATEQSPKPFLNERVEELHGGGRDQRRGDARGIAAKEAEIEFLHRVQRALAS